MNAKERANRIADILHSTEWTSKLEAHVWALDQIVAAIQKAETIAWNAAIDGAVTRAEKIANEAEAHCGGISRVAFHDAGLICAGFISALKKPE